MCTVKSSQKVSTNVMHDSADKAFMYYNFYKKAHGPSAPVLSHKHDNGSSTRCTMHINLPDISS